MTTTIDTTRAPLPEGHACAACGAICPDAELLEVTRVTDGLARYVHRPSVRAGCFGSAIRRRSAETIAQADRETDHRPVDSRKQGQP